MEIENQSFDQFILSIDSSTNSWRAEGIFTPPASLNTPFQKDPKNPRTDRKFIFDESTVQASLIRKRAIANYSVI